MVPKAKTRTSAAFGKGMEFYIIGLMLKEGLECYLPLVDNNGVDVLVKKEGGTFMEVQIKARASGQFTNLSHKKARENYYFVFYSEKSEKIWILSSAEFIEKSGKLENGKHKDSRFIDFSSKKTRERLADYEDTTFERLKNNP